MTLQLRPDPRLLLVVALAAAAGCGGDSSTDTPVSERTTRPAPTSTPSPSATPTAAGTPTPTPTAVATAAPSPAPHGGAEAGAGDEEGIDQGARFVLAADGALSPPRIEVAAFLPVTVILVNAGSDRARFDLSSLGEGHLAVAGGGSREVALAGPRPGRYEISVAGRSAVLESVPGGPG